MGETVTSQRNRMSSSSKVDQHELLRSRADLLTPWYEFATDS